MSKLMTARKAELVIHEAKKSKDDKAVKDLIHKISSYTSKISKLNFMKKQDEAQLRKLLRSTEDGKKSKSGDEKVRKHINTEMAKVKDISMVDRGSLTNAKVEKHPNEDVSDEDDVLSLPFNERSKNFFGKSHTTLDKHVAYNIERNDYEDDRASLCNEITRLTKENFRLASLLSKSTAGQDDAFSGLSLLTSVEPVCHNCEDLKQQLQSKETNLRRSEAKIKSLIREKNRLLQDLSQLNTSEQKTTPTSNDSALSLDFPQKISSQSKKSPARGKSFTEKASNRSDAYDEAEEQKHLSKQKKKNIRRKGFSYFSSGYRVNRYCSTCRKMQKNNHAHFRKYPDKKSGLFGEKRKLIPETKDSYLLSMFVTEEYDRMLLENEKLNSKCAQLKREIEDLQNMISLNEKVKTSSDECSNCLKWRNRHQRLFTIYKDLVDKHKTEQCRHKANYNLLDSQKLKLESDIQKLKENCSMLRTMNETLRKDLLVAESCALQLQQLVLKRGINLRESDEILVVQQAANASQPSHSAAENIPDSESAGSANAKISDALSSRKEKDEEIKKLQNIVIQLEKEYDKFKKTLVDQEDELYRMARALESATDARKDAEKNSLEQSKKTLEEELKEVIADKEYWRNSVLESVQQVREYESLMRDKEKEFKRKLASAKFLDVDTQNAEANKLHLVEKENYAKEFKLLREQLQKMNTYVHELEKDRELAMKQIESLKEDLIDLRKTVLQMDSEKINLLQKLTLKETDYAELKRKLENMTLELQLAKSHSASAAQSSGIFESNQSSELLKLYNDEKEKLKAESARLRELSSGFVEEFRSQKDVVSASMQQSQGEKRKTAGISHVRRSCSTMLLLAVKWEAIKKPEEHSEHPKAISSRPLQLAVNRHKNYHKVNRFAFPEITGRRRLTCNVGGIFNHMQVSKPVKEFNVSKDDSLYRKIEKTKPHHIVHNKKQRAVDKFKKISKIAEYAIRSISKTEDHVVESTILVKTQHILQSKNQTLNLYETPHYSEQNIFKRKEILQHNVSHSSKVAASSSSDSRLSETSSNDDRECAQFEDLISVEDFKNELSSALPTWFLRCRQSSLKATGDRLCWYFQRPERAPIVDLSLKKIPKASVNETNGMLLSQLDNSRRNGSEMAVKKFQFHFKHRPKMLKNSRSEENFLVDNTAVSSCPVMNDHDCQRKMIWYAERKNIKILSTPPCISIPERLSHIENSLLSPVKVSSAVQKHDDQVNVTEFESDQQQSSSNHKQRSTELKEFRFSRQFLIKK
ncbi:Intermediate filament protein [Trichinella pseudospiralis]